MLSDFGRALVFFAAARVGREAEGPPRPAEGARLLCSWCGVSCNEGCKGEADDCSAARAS